MRMGLAFALLLLAACGEGEERASEPSPGLVPEVTIDVPALFSATQDEIMAQFGPGECSAGEAFADGTPSTVCRFAADKRVTFKGDEIYSFLLPPVDDLRLYDLHLGDPDPLSTDEELRWEREIAGEQVGVRHFINDWGPHVLVIRRDVD